MRKRENVTVEFGYCQCGCGDLAPIAKYTSTACGWVKGQPKRYIGGHNNRLSQVDYIERETGYGTPCWIWQRAKSKAGYGLIKNPPRKTSTGRRIWKTFFAHRVYFARVNGPIPKGMQLDHLCRVRDCCNPSHLEMVTNAENTRRGWRTRLKMYQVERVRHLHSVGVLITEIAKIYDVSESVVSNIVNGLTWDAR